LTIQIQTEIAKTLGDDPLAFEYDAVYDEMKKQTSSFPQQENRQVRKMKSLKCQNVSDCVDFVFGFISQNTSSH
jgi:uncharacterized protein YraI